ncbi:unnamed protein product [Kluyveromyces dobzhanskii CBS 2104]|uniref:WGS project CCBQ000000000 data, contig 00102 n=1 Tax=Kluyveromyces dobzhanskii CBS 2104 TaxID=1427455 RepID=A0A0A8L6G9_9SACH|nr:unnamed protein product [Kluyveromyces dobzhanskii CBS 2104]
MARQNFIGMVISQGKMQKTVKVRVETKVFEKRINKELFRRKDYLVHDESEVSREGDLVRIEATRPLSKRKFFSVAEIIRNKGQQFALFQEQAKTNVATEENQKTEAFLKRREQKQDVESTLLSDVRVLQKAHADGTEDSAAVKEIKSRYGIDKFSPESLKQILQLDIIGIESRVKLQQERIDSITERLAEYTKNETLANEFLLSKGLENPQLLKKNIKKNILRKHILEEVNV